MVIGCQQCQFFMGKQKIETLRLQPIGVEAPFQQWGLDFTGQFKDNSSNGYLQRWYEIIPTTRSLETFEKYNSV